MRFISMKRCLTFAHSFPGNKGLEINFYLNEEARSYFSLDLSWTRKEDHAGFTFRFSLWKFEFEFMIYDGRHWNYDADRYFYPGEEQQKRIEYGDVDIL